MFAGLIDHPLVSVPDLLEQIRDEEREISRHRARQVELLREVFRVSWSWSAASTSELAAELDVSADTARVLLETAQRTPERSACFTSLETGEWTFDRAAEVARLISVGADDETVEHSGDHDIAGIRRLRASVRRITRRDERRAHEERHVRSWPSLDRAAGFISAQLGGLEWAIVNRALDERADRFPADGATAEQRRADALVAIAQDSLDVGTVPDTGGGAVVTVTIDAGLAADTAAEAGVFVAGGARIGPDTLDRILCNGSVEIIAELESGRPVALGPTTRVVPPKVRRQVLSRDAGCTIDGCSSRYRLEVHHIVPRSRGGTHHLDNLTTLCWWHHHVAIHRRGGRIDPDSPAHRRRIIYSGGRPPRRGP